MQIKRSVVFPTALAFIATLATGCVSKSKYEELEAKLKETQSALDNRSAEAQNLQSSLQKESAKTSDLSKKATNLEAKASSLEKTVSSVNKDKSMLESSLTKVQTDNDKLRMALAEMERNKAESDKRVAEYQDLLAKFKAMIDSGKLRVRIVDGRMVVALNSDLLFKSGSSNLTSDGTKSVQEVAGLLQSLSDKSFQVEGHTDNVAIRSGKFSSNWDLAAARAISVVQKMIEAGMPAARVSAASFGEHKPAQANESKEGRAANRRVEIVVVPDLSRLPGFEELKQLDTPDTSEQASESPTDHSNH